MSSSQEVFDQIVSHLRKQSCRSVAAEPNNGPTCLYRGPNGTKCAVGCMIPDEIYHPSMEGKGVTTIIKLYFGLLFLSLHRNLLAEMQNIHDNCLIETWEREFQLIAVRYDLKYTFV